MGARERVRPRSREAALKIERLEREQWIEAAPALVFAFFADAANLERLTPPWLGFRIRSPLPIEMKAGAQIAYTLRLGGLPLRWRTEIREWLPGVRFVDVQLRGPYALWEHLHEFRADGARVWMRDTVRYALPLGPLGRLAHALAVRRLLVAIFDYRARAVREIFG